MTLSLINAARIVLAFGSIPLLAAPLPSSAQATARATAGTPAAINVVQAYYQAIDARHYATAWALWGDRGRPGQTYAAFRRGFAATRRVRVSVTGPVRSEGAAGSIYVTIPVRVDGVTTTGERQRFAGSYFVRRVNAVDGSTPSERRWHLYSATLKAVR
jgi:hypothetical protein